LALKRSIAQVIISNPSLEKNQVQCKSSYDRDVKTIFATAVQYPVRLAAAMQRNDLPQEHKECCAQAPADVGGPVASRFRSGHHGTCSLACRHKQIVRVLTSSVGSPLRSAIN